MRLPRILSELPHNYQLPKGTLGNTQLQNFATKEKDSSQKDLI